MKPNDENGKLPTEQRPFRVLIISGSNRRQYNCPGVDSKSRTLMLRMAERLPQDWEIDYEDLGNVFTRARIQSCNACASTSMALCVWPCNCYEPNNHPDRLWRYAEIGHGKKYSDNQAEDIKSEPNFYQEFDAWIDAFSDFVRQKGKVQPNKYRAYGYKAPGHKLADLQLLWRNTRMQLGIPPKDSSVAKQQQAGLNQDIRLDMKKGEGEILRE